MFDYFIDKIIVKLCSWYNIWANILIESFLIPPPQTANLLIDMRKRLFTVVFLPHLVIIPKIKLKHLVKVVPGQLSLCIKRHVAVVVDGVTFHALLTGHEVVVGDWTVAKVIKVYQYCYIHMVHVYHTCCN